MLHAYLQAAFRLERDISLVNQRVRIERFACTLTKKVEDSGKDRRSSEEPMGGKSNIPRSNVEVSRSSSFTNSFPENLFYSCDRWPTVISVILGYGLRQRARSRKENRGIRTGESEHTSESGDHVVDRCWPPGSLTMDFRYFPFIRTERQNSLRDLNLPVPLNYAPPLFFSFFFLSLSLFEKSKFHLLSILPLFDKRKQNPLAF